MPSISSLNVVGESLEQVNTQFLIYFEVPSQSYLVYLLPS
jgi:hypothetical protein